MEGEKHSSSIENKEISVAPAGYGQGSSVGKGAPVSTLEGKELWGSLRFYLPKGTEKEDFALIKVRYQG